ncbi:hypothetical protein N8Z79_06645 [Crocinitomicaceae bacterium]|nr:hypothetical protein [Crocinitomicaceae bacterium]
MKNEWHLLSAIIKQIEQNKIIKLRIKDCKSHPYESFKGIIEDQKGFNCNISDDEFDIITQILKDKHELSFMINYKHFYIEILTKKAMDEMPF